jgi:hypothetical protein
MRDPRSGRRRGARHDCGRARRRRTPRARFRCSSNAVSGAVVVRAPLCLARTRLLPRIREEAGIVTEPGRPGRAVSLCTGLGLAACGAAGSCARSRQSGAGPAGDTVVFIPAGEGTNRRRYSRLREEPSDADVLVVDDLARPTAIAPVARAHGAEVRAPAPGRTAACARGSPPATAGRSSTATIAARASMRTATSAVSSLTARARPRRFVRRRGWPLRLGRQCHAIFFPVGSPRRSAPLPRRSAHSSSAACSPTRRRAGSTP